MKFKVHLVLLLKALITILRSVVLYNLILIKIWKCQHFTVIEKGVQRLVVFICVVILNDSDYRKNLRLLIRCVNISHSTWLLIKNLQVQNCFEDSSNIWPLKFSFESIYKRRLEYHVPYSVMILNFHSIFFYSQLIIFISRSQKWRIKALFFQIVN